MWNIQGAHFEHNLMADFQFKGHVPNQKIGTV